MGEPHLPYGRQTLDEDDVAAVLRVLRGDWLTTGPAVASFERALAARTGAEHAVVVTSGTAALHTAYAACGLSAGDAIVTSPLTFVATATAALHRGATVRFADVDPATGILDPDAAAAVADGAKLLVPVDYTGHPADYDALRAVADRHGMRLVADAAHSLGASFRSRAVGTLADATATSFHPVKPITTGEGGTVLTGDAEIAARAAAFRNHGIVRPEGGPGYHYEVRTLGLNYRLPDVLCALGESQLGKLDRFLARRAAIAARYDAAFASLASVETPVVRDGVTPGWHLYVLRVRAPGRRDVVFQRLRELGLGVQLHYLPVHLHPLFRGMGFGPGAFPVAEDFAARAISLPLFPAMADSDVGRVVDAVHRAAEELL